MVMSIEKRKEFEKYCEKNREEILIYATAMAMAVKDVSSEEARKIAEDFLHKTLQEAYLQSV